MNPSSPADREERSTFQLRFNSLFDSEHAYAFPCDAAGHVDMDALGDRARNDYLYARVVVGHEVSLPKVEACAVSCKGRQAWPHQLASHA